MIPAPYGTAIRVPRPADRRAGPPEGRISVESRREVKRVQLEYFWTDCSDGFHVAVNYTFWEGQVSGSVRRWSPDGSVNEGRRFEVPLAEISRDEAGAPRLVLEGVCGEPLRIPLDPARLKRAEEALANAAA